MLSTYFLEMSVDSGGLDSVPGDYAYYSLSVSIANEDDEAYMETQSSNPDYTGNLAKAIGEIYADPDLHYMAFGYGSVSLPVYYDDIRDRFQGSEQLLAGEPYSSPLGDGGMLCDFASSWQFDRNSMEHFDFQVSEGRLLNEDDFIFDLDETEIPVLVGSEFAAGMAFNVWKFSDMMQWNLMFLWVILGMALLAVLIVSAVFARKLMKVDIEEIIRSEE